MKALLICPAERPHVRALAEAAPLSNLPIAGKCLIEYWLEHLAGRGAKQVYVLATDRPQQVRAVAGDGARWGLRVEVFPETRELTPDEARQKYCAEYAGDWLTSPDDVTLMDHLPELPACPLFSSYAHWMAALQEWMPQAATPDRVGVRELQPGVWVGRHTRVSPSAQLEAPCWLGEDVYVGPDAVIGPRAVVEDRAFVEGASNISDSLIGPDTFVGELTEIRNSIAWGGTLANWKLDSCIKVPDRFLLCPLGERQSPFRPAGWWGRFLAALAIVLTLPLALVSAIRSQLRGRPWVRPRLATRPTVPPAVSVPGDTLVYYELTSGGPWMRRWPQLLNIVRGDFAWVGNRPLSPHEAASLSNDFECLWLAAPVGLVSLADTEACFDFSSDDTRAHASYYAAQADWRLDLAIFARVSFFYVFGLPFSRAREYVIRLFQPAAEVRQAQ